MRNLMILALAASFCFSPEVYAGKNRRVLKTQKRQAKRIRRGVKSGELTKAEAKNLRRDQREINQMRKEAKQTDGKIDKMEMKVIRQAQANASKKIYRKKHNKRDRN